MFGFGRKKKKQEVREEPYDLLDILLDEDNTEPITLTSENGKTLSFEQVAVIPYGDGDNRALYAILKPIESIDGIGDDEAVVFLIDVDDEGNTALRVEENETIARNVFDGYYQLLDEQD